MVDSQSFDAADFFTDDQNLPTILEGDEQHDKLVSSPTESSPATPEPIRSIVEEPKIFMTTNLSNGTNTPDTDKTAVEVGNASSESPITPSSGSNTPGSEKASRS